MTTQRAYRSTQAVLKHHNQAFDEGDLDALMMDYADDAIVIDPQGVATGQDEIREYYRSLFTGVFVQGSTFAIQSQRIVGEIAYVTWKADAPSMSLHYGSDTFVVRDGMIVAQTIAAHIGPKGV